MNQECGLFYRMSNQIFHVIGHWVFIVVISDPTYMEMKKKYGKASYAICNMANI